MATANSKKTIGLDVQKKNNNNNNNNFARASSFFVHFLAVVARLRHENLTQKISPTFDKLNEIK